MKVIVSSCGRYHSVHLAQALKSHGFLQKFFYAGIPADRKSFAKKKIVFNSALSFADRCFTKFALDKFVALSRWYTWRDKLFDKFVAGHFAKKVSGDLFIGWANGCLDSLLVAKSKGMVTVVEAGSMHIAAQEEILSKEFARHQKTAPVVLPENKERMLKEYKLADFIAVPSEHVRQSFVAAGIPKKKLIKNPYGCNVEKFATKNQKTTKGPMIFIFVGMVSLQKGIFYLLSAWKKLRLAPSVAQLHFVGNVSSECVQFVKNVADDKSIVFHGSVKQDALVKYYDQSHVLILPSLQEGLAMVIGEAMANGLLVIASKNSGGYELFLDKKEGLLIDSGSVDQICEKINWCLENREQVIQMGCAAKEVAKNYTWQSYGEKAIQNYQEILEKNGKFEHYQKRAQI